MDEKDHSKTVVFMKVGEILNGDKCEYDHDMNIFLLTTKIIDEGGKGYIIRTLKIPGENVLYVDCTDHYKMPPMLTVQNIT